jgi:Zn-dependent M16 (insulinase) family peptidase
MTTRELIQAEIERMSEEDLEKLYAMARSLTQSQTTPEKSTLMDGLLEIQIEGPPDFATNLDLYLSGEKREEPNIC